MTDIEWGAPIEVNGVRPEWLSGDEQHMFRDCCGEWYGEHVDWFIREHDEGDRWADDVLAIRLPANHPFYLATSRGFTYWPGGEAAPEDWDGGEVLLTDRGPPCKTVEWWDRRDGIADVIGYRKRTEQPAIAPELVERAITFIHKLNDLYKSDIYNSVDWVAGMRALVAEINPDPDLALAKMVNGDVEAIAAAIRAARENGK